MGLYTRRNAEGDRDPDDDEVARADRAQGSINSRINVLYFLDSLCETSLMVKSHSKSERSRLANANGLYIQFVSRDLNRIVESIVPDGKQGLPNLVSAKQVRRADLYSAQQLIYDDPRSSKIGARSATLTHKRSTMSSRPSTPARSPHPPPPPPRRNRRTRRSPVRR